MTPPSTQPPKRLAIFLDGTWNWIANNTNVWRMKSLCSDFDANGVPQATYYDIGVNGLVGGLFGRGLRDNIIEAYKWLVEEYEPGSEVFIFGFSRGAYTARSLTGFISKCGILKVGAPLSIEQLYDRYKRVAEENTVWGLHQRHQAGGLDLGSCELEERWLVRYSQCADVKMVGVWDTVGKYGIPFGEIRNVSTKSFGFLDTGLRMSIKHCFHALAIDEHRAAFPPTLWTIRKPLDPEKPMAAMRPITTCEQRWFAGAHGNIGGGYANDVLAQLPFLWLMSKAERLGLSFKDSAELDGDLSAASPADSYKDFAWGTYSLVSRRKYRLIDGPPLRDDRGTHLHVNETIDQSVFDFARQASYRSWPLMEWAARKNVDPGSIYSSVRADDPKVTVDD